MIVAFPATRVRLGGANNPGGRPRGAGGGGGSRHTGSRKQIPALSEEKGETGPPKLS